MPATLRPRHGRSRQRWGVVKINKPLEGFLVGPLQADLASDLCGITLFADTEAGEPLQFHTSIVPLHSKESKLMVWLHARSDFGDAIHGSITYSSNHLQHVGWGGSMRAKCVQNRHAWTYCLHEKVCIQYGIPALFLQRNG